MSDKKPQIVSDLKRVFGGLVGQDLSGADSGGNFLDLGFDSLLLTQVAAAMKVHFGVKVTFRQLNEDLSSFAALAGYIGDKRAPQQTVSIPDAAAAVTPSSAVEPVSLSPNPPPPSILPMVASAVDGPGLLLRPTRDESSLTGTVLERVVKEQLRVMEMQLAMLRASTPGKGAGPAVPVGSPMPPPVASSPAAPPSPAAGIVPALGSAPAAGQHGPFRQLDKGKKGGLTTEQQAHLDWLIPRYVAKSPKSKEYTQNHRKHFADPRAVAGFKQNWKEMVYPIVATRSSGAYLWDLDGNRWVDVTMGFGVALLGHSPAFITEAVKRQLELGVEIGPQSPLAGEVAQLICEFTGMERVTFCNTGSEAVMAALRICRTVTARTKVLLFSGAYHGTFDEVLVKGAWVNGEPKTLPIAPGVAPNLVSEVVVLEYGTPQSLEWIRQHSEELAAVLVETVQSRHPDLQPVEFLQEVRRITKATETPLIFDEVITGFRCHPGGAQALFGIEADLATYGKIIGGGMPFGFIAGKAWLMDAFDGGFWQFGDDSVPPAGVTFFAGTFVRHPLAMAAARAMLLHLKEQGPQLQATLASRTDRMIGDLNCYLEQHQVPLRLEHFASGFYPHFGAEVKFGSLLYFHLREKGLHIWEGRPCFLSTAHVAVDEAFIEHAFKLSVAEMQIGGFLAGTSKVDFVEEAKRRTGEMASLPTLPLLSGAIQPSVSLTMSEKSLSTGNALAAAGRESMPLASPLPTQDTSRFPLTEGQVEMWLAAQVAPEAAGPHHASNVIHLEGELDVAVLRRAVEEVIRRHEALRCTFNAEGTEIVVVSSLPYEMPIHDLSALPANQREVRKLELINQEGQRIFDLTNGPLFAFVLIRLSPQEHLLVFTVQMIICDGWGYNLVLEDLGAIYSANLVRRQPLLGPAIPMREYVRWQVQQEQPGEATARGQYWLAQFQTLPPVLELPTFQPRPPVRSFAGSRQSLRLPAALYTAIKSAARELKNTPFALLLAAYQSWLFRLSGQHDLVVGVPFAGQGGAGMETLVGQCVHTLPLRLKVEAGETFASLLQKARGLLLDAQEHWNYSFSKLVQQLDLPRDASRIPLVSVTFNLDLPMSKVQFAGCHREITASPRFYFQYDLGFNLVDEGSTLLVECDYNLCLYDADTISRWLGHFQTLIEGAVANPREQIDRLPLLSESQQRQLVHEWNETARELPQEATVHGLVVAQTARTPDAVAVQFAGQSLTYAELEQRSNRLGNLLRSLGVGPDTLVGVCVERNLDMVVALLAVLKAGGAYVPLDPDFPPERIGATLEDTATPVLLTHGTLLTRLPKTSARIVCLDEDREGISRESATLDPALVGPTNLAYVIYTSGSTGQPKGVEITHQAFANFLLSMRSAPGIEPSDAVLALTTLSFDIAGLELFLPLTVGARVVMVTRETLLDPPRLSQLVAERNVTIMQGTPATWRMLINGGWQGRPGLKLLCGGEALGGDLAARLLAFGGELWNLYGPTETTVWSTVRRIQPGEPITIGRPIANTQIYVLDEQKQPVPVGVPGELFIGGIGLARSYRNRPELTAEKFVAHPFVGVPGARLYHTGDCARYRADGEIEFLGRRDFQVKLRGYRIELGEIETILLGHTQVREAVVLVREDWLRQPRLVAYLALAKEAVTASLLPELRLLLRRRLPEYMVPSAYVVLDALPRSSEGKVARQELPAPSAESMVDAADTLTPRNQTEEDLARIWLEILKLEKVGVRDNFFDLGGQSLLAVSLFAKIEREFGRKLPLATLFRSPTIEQLALALTDQGGKTAQQWNSLVPVQPNGKLRPLFLVHGAGGNVLLYRWLAQHLAPDFPLYGLQSRGLDGLSQPLKTIEEMAVEYLKEIRTVQPSGPYFLGGYCLGGTVAYEMAQILHREGEEVPLIAMLDTYNFSRALKISFASFMIQKVRFHFGNFTHLRPRDMFNYVREKVRVARDGELANLMTSMPGSTMGQGAARAESGIEASVQVINDHAADHYLPKPYPGRLVLFKPHINYKFYPDPNMGWADLALGGLDFEELPVNPHAMLVEPFVRDLAARLKVRMKQLQTGALPVVNGMPNPTSRSELVLAH